MTHISIDVFHHIFPFINDGKTWKQCQLVSRDCYMITKGYKDYQDKLTNHLITLLMMYPNKDWNYKLLSSNPNVSWEFIESHPEIPWDFAMLSLNPNVTWDIVLTYPDKGWNYEYLSINPNITIDIIIENPSVEVTTYDGLVERGYNRHDWSMKWFSMNTNVTIDTVLAYPNLRWNYFMFSMNPNVTWDIIEAHPEIPWDFAKLSLNPNINRDIVASHPNKPWNYSALSNNPGMNIPWMYEFYINSKSHWEELLNLKPRTDEEKYRVLSADSKLVWDAVKKDKDKPWDFNIMSINKFNKS